MAKKSKHMTGKPFTTEVCDAIRHHVGERKALESKRKNAFEDRDAALAEKAEIDDHDSEEYFEACRRHSDAIASIDSLSSQIKWHHNQVDELIEKADEPAFPFVYEPPAEPAKKDPRQLKLADAGKDTRPVGRPGKPKPEAPDPSKGDGVDEHLAADVKELDLPEYVIGKLVKAGLTTVGRVVAVIDGGKDLAGEANISDDQATATSVAIAKYRKKHRKAMVAAERVA